MFIFSLYNTLYKNFEYKLLHINVNLDILGYFYDLNQGFILYKFKKKRIKKLKKKIAIL